MQSNIHKQEQIRSRTGRFLQKADILPQMHRNRESLLICIIHRTYAMFEYKSGVNSLNNDDGEFIEF